LVSAEALCRQHGIEFISFPIPDHGVPTSLKEATGIVQMLTNRLGDGKAIAVHCRAGIGRSSLIAASVLVHLRADPAGAFDLIGQARGLSVPDTDAQREWVTAFCRFDSR
jgi:Cyclin-dependent kinase inhibitor 3 (CDKN3)